MLEKIKCSHIDISHRENSLDCDFDALVPAVEQTEGECEKVAEYTQKQRERQGMDVLPLAIYEQMLEKCLEKRDFRSAFWLTAMANMGLRYSDVVKLRRADFIDEHSHIRDSILIQEKKTQKQRIVFVNKAIKETLLMLLWNSDIAPLDFLITSNGNNKRYETETYTDSNGRKKVLRKNGKAVYKLDENGNRIPKPLTREQSANIMKGIIADTLGVGLKNYGDGEGYLRISTHSIRKLYGWAVTNDFIREFDSDEAYAHAAALSFLSQDYGHSSEAMTLRYSKDFEGLKREICTRMNLGLRVIEPYFEKEMEKYRKELDSNG